MKDNGVCPARANPDLFTRALPHEPVDYEKELQLSWLHGFAQISCNGVELEIHFCKHCGCLYFFPVGTSDE